MSHRPPGIVPVLLAAAAIVWGCGTRDPGAEGDNPSAGASADGGGGAGAAARGTGGPLQGAGGAGGARSDASAPSAGGSSDAAGAGGGAPGTQSDGARPGADTGPRPGADGGVAATDGLGPGRDAGAGASDGPAAPAVARAQCLKDTDCVLINDCCNCQAIGRDEKAPFCDPKIACLQTACMEFGGVERPRCTAGRCILGFDCDTTTVTCKRATPICPAGQVPKVTGQGLNRCFGECVDARQCAFIPACAGCSKDDLCVRTYDGGRALYHCVPPLLVCGVAQSCSCAGPAVCLPPVTTCTSSTATSPRELTCGTP